MTNKKHILSILPEDLSDFVEKKYRINQIFHWIYKKLTLDFYKMSNLKRTFQDKLAENFDNSLPETIKIETSLDNTKKFLLRLQDNNYIEMVLIPYKNKNTLCISSQVGCMRNCKFCATGKMGLIRNLKTYEIISQLFIANKLLNETNEKITNIVFMGMGEPLDNLENVLSAIKILQNENTFSFSPRRITISTSGVVPKIDILSKIDLKIKLAVSLNSAIDEKRDILMPINKIYPLKELKKSLINFRKHSPYRITFEYVMIKNFNMGQDDIKSISSYLGDISCKLNLIPWNKVDFSDFESPTEDDILKFENKLKNNSFAITRRKSRGSDISAACGQLAISKTIIIVR